MLLSRLFAILSQTVRYIQAFNVRKIFSQKENHELFHSSSLNISRVISTREGKLFSGLEFGSCLLCRTFDTLRCWNKTQRISQMQNPCRTKYICKFVWIRFRLFLFSQAFDLYITFTTSFLFYFYQNTVYLIC